MVVHKTSLFYNDDSLLASNNPVCTQWGFNILIILFERFRIRKNVAKTAAMVCQPGPISGRNSAAAYERQMTREIDPHWERHIIRVVCG